MQKLISRNPIAKSDLYHACMHARTFIIDINSSYILRTENIAIYAFINLESCTKYDVS